MPITINGSGTVTGISAGGLPAGTVTETTLSTSAVQLVAPPGAIAFVCQSSAPTGWLKANGATMSRTAYSALFTAIGTTFGAGDGSTTFKLPDLRGYFPRGWDDAAGVDTGRSFGTSQQGTYLRTMMNDYTDGDTGTTSVNYFVGMGHSNPDDVQSTGTPSPLRGDGVSWGGTLWDNASTANHNNNVGFNARWIRVRPANVALLAVIKF